MSFFKNSDNNLLHNAYGINIDETHLGYRVSSYIDNLHLDFLKRYNLVPKDSITCVNSKEVYKLIL